jgi:hypothetical protein
MWGGDANQFGPWEVAGHLVEIEVTPKVRLVAKRDGVRLNAIPPAVRESGDYAWMKVSVYAAEQHFRDVRLLLENAMAEQIRLTGDDLAVMALNPISRGMLANLLLRASGVVGRALPEDWLLETVEGDLAQLQAPANVVHPIELHLDGSLPAWDRWLNRGDTRQPFKQIRREIFTPNAQDLAAGTYSDRYAGEVIRWDQARALLEGRGWYRVTKTGAERVSARAGLTSYLEFRTPAARRFSREDVVINRAFFLPRNEAPQNKANPGMPLAEVPSTLFSETIRDVGLIAQVAGRGSKSTPWS